MKVRNLISVAVLMFFALTSCDNDPVYNLSIYPRDVHFSKSGGEKEIEILANSSWEVVVADDFKSWITVDPAQSDIPNAKLTVKVTSENTEAKTRVGTIHVRNGDNVQKANVIQYGTDADVAPNKVVAKWVITKCEKPSMIGSEFTFNDDNSCLAKITVMGGAELPATYVLDGNIILISIPMGQKKSTMEIIILSISGDDTVIETIAGGYSATIKKVE